MTTGEPTTGEIVRALRDAPNYNGMAGTTTTVEDIAADRLESQEQRIAELEAENRDILQNSVSHTTHAEFVSDYQQQIDERDAMIAELERDLAAAKEDMNKVGNCTICAKNCKPSEIVAIVGNGEKCFEWRGAQEET